MWQHHETKWTHTTKKRTLPLRSKIKLLNSTVLSTLLWHCHVFEKINFILTVSCNSENKLKVTFQFPSTKATFI